MKSFIFCYSFSGGSGHAVVRVQELTIESVEQVVQQIKLNNNLTGIAITNIIPLEPSNP